MKPKIKVGFVGQGRHATTNLYSSLPYAGIELAATCANHNADFTDYKEMIEKVKMDALIVCVNAQVHYEIASVVSKIMPVFIEKPPAPSAEMAGLLADSPHYIMVGFNKRFAPVFQTAKRIIAKPLSMTMNVHVGKCRDRKELIREIGIHYADLFDYFGVKGDLAISDNLSWERAVEHIEILGEGKLAVIDNGILTYHTEDKTTIIAPNHVIPCKENLSIFQHGYVGELSYFAEMVSRKQKGTPSILEGYKALKILEKYE